MQLTFTNIYTNQLETNLAIVLHLWLITTNVINVFAPPPPHFFTFLQHSVTYKDKLRFKRNFEQRPIFLTYCGIFLHPRTTSDLTK